MGLLLGGLCMGATALPAQNTFVHDSDARQIYMETPGKELALQIDYSEGCRVKELRVKGQNVLAPTGVYTAFTTRGGRFSSTDPMHPPVVAPSADGFAVKGIRYGNRAIEVDETWNFRLRDEKVEWTISRAYSNLAKLEETAFPQWNFADMNVWKGGILDNGGMVWCKYLQSPNDTYGVHTGGVTFWNPDSRHALRLVPHSEGRHLSARYSRGEQGTFVCSQSVSDMELEPRYNLNRFVGQRADVFAPFDVQKDTVTLTLELEYVDYATAYSRGNLPGIDAEAVRELMNTTGRYGVVDNGIVGANGWLTNWKCLHEPFFAQIGMALNDGNYVRNLSASLDRERDYALMSDGRVLSRWHGTDEDQMPGTFNYKTGYYEAVWGYTADSQTGHVINVSEQFDLCGDVAWLRAHKEGCERALDWLIRRDSNDNGIFEMMNNTIAEGKCSDWLDIVWAGFENAFVNAQMYEALTLWAECERILGDAGKYE